MSSQWLSYPTATMSWKFSLLPPCVCQPFLPSCVCCHHPYVGPYHFAASLNSPITSLSFLPKPFFSIHPQVTLLCLNSQAFSNSSGEKSVSYTWLPYLLESVHTAHAYCIHLCYDTHVEDGTVGSRVFASSLLLSSLCSFCCSVNS